MIVLIRLDNIHSSRHCMYRGIMIPIEWMLSMGALPYP